jgi:hypothetical protein
MVFIEQRLVQRVRAGSAPTLDPARPR